MQIKQGSIHYVSIKNCLYKQIKLLINSNKWSFSYHAGIVSESYNSEEIERSMCGTFCREII